MNVVRATEAPTFDIPGIRFTSLATPSLGSSGTCVWQLTVEGGVSSETAHVLDQDEVFVVLAGGVRLVPDGPELGVGDAAVVPAGDPIQLVNPGSSPARLQVAIRAGFTATMADGTPVGTPPWAA
ncbi:cupin domain-containing protein [Nocardioides panacisoli]|uniref:Cupin type-2 domain-containing protein n=1 Tax=Nocardioides panacisoli TaxID=627624 RepID=A0ABP7IJ52_9ACTN